MSIADLFKRHYLFLFAAAGVIAADQALKWVVLNLLPLHEKIAVVPGFLNIVHYRNPGGAFGLFSAQSGLLTAVLFIGVTIAALGFIIYLYFRTPADGQVLAAGLALVFGGAAGNLIDRLRFGNVVDFIDLYVGNYHWPAFNLADSAITLGMIIFAWHVIFKKMPA